jgi:hypothetical protein
MTDPIVKNFVTDFGAVADGTTDNLPAVDRWLAWGRAQGQTPIELYMPPGKYHFSDWAALTDGLYNVTISGYGAIVDSLFIGSLQSAFDFNHSARIQTVSAGSTSINLVNPADAAKFSPGQWILVSGLELQGGIGGQPGYPPNFQFFEYKQITSVSGSVVTLASALTNSYESTWPLVPNFDPVFDQGGPATIYALPPTFDSQQTILGLEVTAGKSDGAVFMNGRSIVLDGMKFDGLGPAPSFGQSILIRNCYIGFTNEVDKVVTYVEYDNDTGHSVLVQSAAPTTLVIKGSTFDLLAGTAQNTFIETSKIGLVIAGPLFFGVGQRLSIAGSTISTAQEADQGVDPSILAFSNGTFSIPTTSAYAYKVFSWAVPGHEYAIAYYDGAIHRQDDTGHVTTFTILDVRQDATYTYIDTDLGTTLPTPTFLGGRPANQYVSYPVMAVSETNSGPAHFKIGEVAAPVLGPLNINALGNFDNDGSIDFVWTSNASISMVEYNPATQAVTHTNLGPIPNWAVVASAHFSNANGTSSTQMLMDYTPTGTMTLWWVSNGALTGINLGERWPNIGLISAGQFTNNGGAGISNFLVTNVVDNHLYDWWIGPNNALQGIDLGPFWGSSVQLVTVGHFDTKTSNTELLVRNTVDHHLYEWWIGPNNNLQGIDLGPYWSNVALVGAGQFTTNGGTNLLVSNTVDHHLYDWWIGPNSTLHGIDLGPFWVSSIQLVTVGHFDYNTTNTELLVQNTVDHHLYEWWITPQGKLTGIDLGPYWGDIQLIANGHFNNNSANDELLVRNTVDGHFYEWWISNNALQGVDLGPIPAGNSTSSMATAAAAAGVAGPLAASQPVTTSSATSVASSTSGDGLTSHPTAAGLLSMTPDSTSLLVQAMASFGSSSAVVDSNSAPIGIDATQQSELAAPFDQTLVRS